MAWAGVAVKRARNTGMKDQVRSRLRLGDGSHITWTAGKEKERTRLARQVWGSSS